MSAVEMLFKRYVADYVKPQSLHMRGNGKDQGEPHLLMLVMEYKLPSDVSSSCDSCRDTVPVW